MRWKGILSVGLLLLSVPTIRAEDTAAIDALKAENERLRRERDATEFRLRMLQEQLDEARRRMLEEPKPVRAEPPRPRVLPEPAPMPVVRKPATVRGKVTGMTADLRLMQISVGTDAGAREGQTLDVYRLTMVKDKVVPLYLGTLRLTRVDPQTSIGTFERVPGLDRAPKVGDEVGNDFAVK